MSQDASHKDSSLGDTLKTSPTEPLIQLNCRVCSCHVILLGCLIPLRSPFGNGKPQMNIREALLFCVPKITVQYTDHICNKCLKSLEITYSFIKTCLETESQIEDLKDKGLVNNFSESLQDNGSVVFKEHEVEVKVECEESTILQPFMNQPIKNEPEHLLNRDTECQDPIYDEPDTIEYETLADTLIENDLDEGIPRLRALWTEASLQQALQAIQDGMPVLKASTEYKIPRRTLRNHLATGSKKKKLGRKSLLNAKQEQELCQRIFRLAEVGMPLTESVLRKSVFSFAEEHCLNHGFSQITRMAGRKWMHLFYRRHPEVVQRKAQALNPAKALKLNKYNVRDYFQKLQQVLVDLSLISRPECIYNMDEKGLTLHHQEKGLTKKRAHAENVTVVACGNASGQAIPPMILFEGVRQEPEWIDSMPPGTVIEMTAKGSMTTAIFIKWLNHFAKFKAPGRCLLVLDGAASHLDAGIVEAADAAEISLLCLPSGELQPLDKFVFRSFERFWDEEVLNYCELERRITKEGFGHIFGKIWPKAMSAENLISGFRVTGLYPYNPDVIEEAAFAHSLLTEKPRVEAEEDNPLTDDFEWSDSDVLPSSILRQRKNPRPADYQQVNNPHVIPKPSCSHWPENAGKELTSEPSNDLENSSGFLKILTTPEMKTYNPRRKALNSSAQHVSEDSKRICLPQFPKKVK